MSREVVLASIRRGLRRGVLPTQAQDALRDRLAAHRRHLIPARSRVGHAERIALFVANLEREFASCDQVPTAADVPGAVADYLASQNLPGEFAIAPHPELRAIPWEERPLLRGREGRARANDLVSIQHGWCGIAETGTLMLPSDAVRPTTLNLLSDTAIVVLRAERVVGAYEEAWDLLRAEHQDERGGFMPRNVMWVTGPSRSADIESVLELGAHGPRRLHVVLVEASR